MELKEHPISIALSAAVPLHIITLKESGGPTSEQFKELQGISDDLGSNGDKLLYGSKKKGEAASLFNRTARAIAIMSFVPGGIDIFGMHFESKAE